MANQDIRWVQRYRHFVQAFEQLKNTAEPTEKRDLSDSEEQGMIQAFGYVKNDTPYRRLKKPAIFSLTFSLIP